MLFQPCKQRGFALIAALLLLVVVLMLSLTSMQGSRTQESMSGNYRASERALMAAEYGAAAVSNVILGEEFEGGTLQELFSAFEDFVRGEVSSDSNEEGLPSGYLKVGDDNAYLRFSVGGVDSGQVTLVSIGEVYSGVPGGANSEVVARRDIEFSFDIDIGYPSAINMMCPVDYFMPSTPSGVSTDDLPVVDSNSRIRPAVAAGSLSGAIKMTAKVLGGDVDVSSMSASEIESIEQIGPFQGNPKYVAKRAKLGGVYSFHAENYVEDGGVDYTNACRVSNNPMCGVIGGISEEAGAPPLASPATFHDFLSTLFALDADDYENIVYIDAENFSEELVQAGKINIITSGRHHVLLANESSGADEDLKARPIIFGGSESYGEDGELVDFSLDVAAWYDSQGDYMGLLSSPPPSPYYAVGDFDDVVSGGEVSGLFNFSTYFPTDYPVLSVEKIVGDDWSSFDFDGRTLVRVEGDEPFGIDYDSYLEALDEVSYQDKESGGFEKGGRPTTISFDQNFSPRNSAGVKVDDPTFVVVDGNLEIGTRPQFKGMFIVLGDYAGSGGGNPGEAYVKGSIIVAPYYFSSGEDEMVCQDAGFVVQGAGNFKAEFDRDAVNAVLNMLPPEVLLKWLGDRPITPELSEWREPVVY